jgi:hypothetical protein
MPINELRAIETLSKAVPASPLAVARLVERGHLLSGASWLPPGPQGLTSGLVDVRSEITDMGS